MPARTCGTCECWLRPSDEDTVGMCGQPDASCRVALIEGEPMETLADFGCRFWRPGVLAPGVVGPAAYRAALVDAGVVAVFAALYAQAGRTALPLSVDGIGRATRERLEIAVVRILQSAGVLS